MLGLHRLNSFTPEPLHNAVDINPTLPRGFNMAPIQQNLYNDFDDVELKEESSKYIIHFQDDHISQKEVRIDFNREENELTVHVTNNTDSAAASYSSVVKFDKHVSYDDILADVNGDNVVIQIPKLHPDQL